MQGVVLIVIDCLRADHLSCYGYHRATTPTIDALAERGILWQNAYAASSWTKPSVTSIFTGVYPSQHGVFRGVKRTKGRSEATTDVLAATHTTLAESLTTHGWRCGAFMNNAQLGEYAGLNRGYDAYVSNAGKADRLLGLFFDWLDADTERPFFAYLHFLEAHWPYKPRRRHIAEFGGNRDTNCFRDFSARDFGRLRRSIRRREATLSEDQLTQLIQMYDGAVRRLDGKVKTILSSLQDRGIDEDTAVFVTGDHGEEFLDHGQIGHGQSLYEELVHVPLVGFVPNTDRGIRCTEPVSLTDLTQMVLGAAGVEDAPNPNSRLQTSDADAAVYAELSVGGTYTQTIRTGDWKLHRRLRFAAADQSGAARPSPWEQANDQPHEVELELYHLGTDPSETTNLANEPGHLSRRADLVVQMDRWWKSTASSETCEVEMDPRIVKRLRDLGYID